MTTQPDKTEGNGEPESSKDIIVKLVSTNCGTHWPCHVCGGHTDKVGILAEAGDWRNPDVNFIRVCEMCLEAGQDQIDARLAAHIGEVRQEADELETLIGRIKIPTYQEWVQAEQDYGASWR